MTGSQKDGGAPGEAPERATVAILRKFAEDQDLTLTAWQKRLIDELFGTPMRPLDCRPFARETSRAALNAGNLLTCRNAEDNANMALVDEYHRAVLDAFGLEPWQAGLAPVPPRTRNIRYLLGHGIWMIRRRIAYRIGEAGHWTADHGSLPLAQRLWALQDRIW